MVTKIKWKKKFKKVKINLKMWEDLSICKTARFLNTIILKIVIKKLLEIFLRYTKLS